jgi:prevent-host-death family protein
MIEIGAYEAKTHLPRLLERVQQGERFVITRYGQPVAELLPYPGHDAETTRLAVAAMRKLRTALARRGVNLGEILNRGESLRALAHDDESF